MLTKRLVQNLAVLHLLNWSWILKMNFKEHVIRIIFRKIITIYMKRMKRIWAKMNRMSLLLKYCSKVCWKRNWPLCFPPVCIFHPTYVLSLLPYQCFRQIIKYLVKDLPLFSLHTPTKHIKYFNCSLILLFGIKKIGLYSNFKIFIV